MSHKNRLLERAWEKKEYSGWRMTEATEIFWKNPAMVRLYELTRSSKRILDFGCGDGKIIKILWRSNAKFYGIDLSKNAIQKAKKRFLKMRNVKIKMGDLEKISFKTNKFDMVYSTYVLEHVDEPEVVIRNMIRLVKKNGLLVLICPNYGSPIEYSPGSPKKGETLKSRAIIIFVKTLVYKVRSPDGLDWRRVEPPVLKLKKWFQDSDVTQEPYVGTLVTFLKGLGVEVLEISSGISELSGRLGIWGMAKKICLRLGKLGITPFKYFGPRILVVGRKNW